MIRICLTLMATFCLLVSHAQAAGIRFIQFPEERDNPPIDAAIWSPCTKAPEAVRIKSLTIKATPDCPVDGEGLPLIVISHGYGGWYLGHQDTAEALADAGFIVVAINHPHANYADMSRANGLQALLRRPLDIKRTIDFMLDAFPDAKRIDPHRVGFYGFSQGGYTGLMLAGASPDFSKLPPRCAGASAGDCPPPSPSTPPPPRPMDSNNVLNDPRIGAMVVADPLSIMFQTEKSVDRITIPLQIWASEYGGGQGASPADVNRLAHILPVKPDLRIAKGAVHLSFLTMCPDDRKASEVCADAPGFDRAAFHETFNTEIVTFFKRNLSH